MSFSDQNFFIKAFSFPVNFDMESEEWAGEKSRVGIMCRIGHATFLQRLWEPLKSYKQGDDLMRFIF